MSRLLFLFLFAVGLVQLPARGDIAPASSSPVIDPATVHQHYQQVLARPEFCEPDKLAGDFPLRDWLSQWVTHLVSRFQDFKYAGQMSGLAWLLVATMTTLATAGLILVLVRLSKGHHGPKEDPGEASRNTRRFLSPRVYDQNLREAIEQHDWRGAWLAAWLQFLSRLEQRQLVEADRSRTNHEYLAQLRKRPLPETAGPLLAGLVGDYDRFIYGRRRIDEPVWRAFRQQIDEATLLLHLLDRTGPTPQTEEAA